MSLVGGYRLDVNKMAINALRKIYGIGENKARQIISLFGIKSDYKFKEIDYKYIMKMDKIIVHYVHGYQAKRNKNDNITLLVSNRSYRGVRHTYFLSVRGQKTHKNAKTQRKKKNKKK